MAELLGSHGTGSAINTDKYPRTRHPSGAKYGASPIQSQPTGTKVTFLEAKWVHIGYQSVLVGVPTDSRDQNTNWLLDLDTHLASMWHQIWSQHGPKSTQKLPK